jgi:hypothetical protein
MKYLIIVIALALSACHVASDDRTPAQKIEDTKARMARVDAFLHLCDTNGGVKYYTDHGYCGRGCSRPEIVCNNGLAATFKD